MYSLRDIVIVEIQGLKMLRATLIVVLTLLALGVCLCLVFHFWVAENFLHWMSVVPIKVTSELSMF